MAQADLSLQSALCESAREEADTQAVEMLALHGQLAAKSTKLLQLSSKHVMLTYELSHVKLQSVARHTVPRNLKLVAEACKRPAKRAKPTRRCEHFSAIPYTAVFSVRLAE